MSSAAFPYCRPAETIAPGNALQETEMDGAGVCSKRENAHLICLTSLFVALFTTRFFFASMESKALVPAEFTASNLLLVRSSAPNPAFLCASCLFFPPFSLSVGAYGV